MQAPIIWYGVSVGMNYIDKNPYLIYAFIILFYRSIWSIVYVAWLDVTKMHW
jgi:hypothetical protein